MSVINACKRTKKQLNGTQNEMNEAWESALFQYSFILFFLVFIIFIQKHTHQFQALTITCSTPAFVGTLPPPSFRSFLR